MPDGNEIGKGYVYTWLKIWNDLEAYTAQQVAEIEAVVAKHTQALPTAVLAMPTETLKEREDHIVGFYIEVERKPSSISAFLAKLNFPAVHLVTSDEFTNDLLRIIDPGKIAESLEKGGLFHCTVKGTKDGITGNCRSGDTTYCWMFDTDDGTYFAYMIPHNTLT